MLRRSYRYISLSALLILAWPVFVSGAVSQISFTTDPQTIKLNEISGTITVQLQDSSGASSPSTETIDIEFGSTSASGEFLSPTSASPVTKTISTGSANKNFRYRDSSEGVFTLTVTAKGRVTGNVWSKTQNITISNSAATTASTSSPTTATTTTPVATSTPETPPNNDVIVRTTHTSTVYYSSVPLSNFEEEKPFQVSAGQNRLNIVGSPLEFKAQANISYLRNTDFRWNFGDGSEGFGETVVHTYEYPGEYVVMLNASSPEGEAISRADVKVIRPDLEIVTADQEKVEVRNNSLQEVSLFGRVLWTQEGTFAFPQDTIVRNSQSITLSSKVTGLQPQSPHDVRLLVVGQTESAKISEKIEEERLEEIVYLEVQLAELQSQLALLSTQPSQKRIDPVQEEVASLAVAESVETEQQTAAASESGWWELIKSFFLGN